jgi:diguanylate cyclase (GGDEF)-like protein
MTERQTMKQYAFGDTKRILAVMRPVALAGFALARPTLPPDLLGLAVLYVAAASILSAVQPRSSVLRVFIPVALGLVDVAGLTAAVLHFGPASSVAPLIAACVAGVAGTVIPWGWGVDLGLLGALAYYGSSLVYYTVEQQAAGDSLIAHETAVIALAGGLTAYVVGEWCRLGKMCEAAQSMRRLNAAGEDMVAAQGDRSVISAALSHAAALADADRAWIMVADAEEQLLTLEGQIGASPPRGMATTVPAGNGVAGQVVSSRQPVMIAGGAQNDSRLADLERELTDGHLLAVPISDATDALGVLMVSRQAAKPPFGDADVTVVTMLARTVGAKLQAARLIRDLHQAATTDSLTGLHNHGTFLDHLTERVRRATMIGQETALVVLDLDRFKSINDTAGHAAANQVLKALADVLRQQCRSSDVIGRCGGDEFAVLLPGTGAQEAARIARRAAAALREAGERLALPLPVTASWGIACAPKDARDGEALFRMADERLYGAKSAGGDLVAAPTTPDATPQRLSPLMPEPALRRP